MEILAEGVEDATVKKIHSIEELVRIVSELRSCGKRIVQCHGVFDILHAGHIRHLCGAKEHGDILVVTLTKDKHVRKGPGRPVFSEQLRAETLAALEVVDYVALVDSPTAVECLRQLKPDVYVKGPDYRNVELDVTGMIEEETKVVYEMGGQLVITDDPVVFSSSNLINRFFDLISDQQRVFLQRIRDTYRTSHYIVDQLRRLKSLRVLIIGDAIIDEYVYCEPLGQSLKHPIVVHRFLSEERFCGGVIAVANQVAEFCEEVNVVTLLGGTNNQEEYLRSQLRANVHMHHVLQKDIPTIIKRRYLYENAEHKVFEICYLEDVPQHSEAIEHEIAAVVDRVSSDVDVVMITDYGHGLMTKRLAQEVRRNARFLAVNAQTNSANIGYNLITKKYSGPDFVCIDEGESRLALHDKHMPIEQLGEELARLLKSHRLIITCGRNGSVGFEAGKRLCAAPALAARVVDRVGAGDAFFSVTAPCSAINLPIDLISLIGNAIGALAVQVVGNRHAISSADLFKFIGTLLK